MLKIQNVDIAVSGETETEIIEKLRAALSNAGFVDFVLRGQLKPAAAEGVRRHAGGIYREGSAFPSKDGLDHYLIWVEGDVEPILKGPYGTDQERLLQARLLKDQHGQDGTFRLDVPAGTQGVSVSSFTGGEIEEDDLVTEICRSLLRGEHTWSRIATSDNLTFQYMGDEVLVSAEDRLAVAAALGQNLYVIQGELEDYVAMGDHARCRFTQDHWRDLVSKQLVTVGYEQWVREKMSELGRLVYTFPDRI